MELSTPRRWYQFTVGRAMGAIFWMGVCFGLIALSSWYKEPDQNPPLFITIATTTYLSPFVAAGTLFGHPFRGLAAGVAVVGGTALAAYIAIDHGWVGFP